MGNATLTGVLSNEVTAMTSNAQAIELLRPDDVAVLLDTNTATLAAWRSKGCGPNYLKIGKHVRYFPHDVKAYLEEARVITDKLERKAHEARGAG